MMYLTTSYKTDQVTKVWFLSGRNDSYEVQVFLGGSARQTLYMTAEYARAFAQQILDVVPAPAEETS